MKYVKIEFKTEESFNNMKDVLVDCIMEVFQGEKVIVEEVSVIDGTEIKVP